MSKDTRIMPILINCQDKGNQIGIEYKDGKYILFGKEHMDEGVEIFFNELKHKLKVNDENLLQQQQEKERSRVIEMVNKITNRTLGVQYPLHYVQGYERLKKDILEALKEKCNKDSQK